MEILYSEGGERKVVSFDATIKEQSEAAATATKYPIEDGAPVTDHVQAELDILSCVVHVTNTPVRSPDADGMTGEVSSLSLRSDSRAQRTGAKVGASGNVDEATYETKTVTAAASVLQFTDPPDRVQAVYDVLTNLCKLGVELQVVTTRKEWTSMLLLRVGTIVHVKDAQEFTLDFQELIFAETETVDTPEPLETRAERERRLGARGTEDAESEEDISLAAQLLERVTGIGLIGGGGS